MHFLFYFANSIKIVTILEIQHFNSELPNFGSVILCDIRSVIFMETELPVAQILISAERQIWFA